MIFHKISSFCCKKKKLAGIKFIPLNKETCAKCISNYIFWPYNGYSCKIYVTCRFGDLW